MKKASLVSYFKIEIYDAKLLILLSSSSLLWQRQSCDVLKSRDNIPDLSLETPEAGQRSRRPVSVEPFLFR